MVITPEAVLTWWDVVDRIGLVGVIVLINVFVGIFLWRNAPKWLENDRARTAALSKQNELLERIEARLGDGGIK